MLTTILPNLEELDALEKVAEGLCHASTHVPRGQLRLLLDLVEQLRLHVNHSTSCLLYQQVLMEAGQGDRWQCGCGATDALAAWKQAGGK